MLHPGASSTSSYSTSLVHSESNLFWSRAKRRRGSENSDSYSVYNKFDNANVGISFSTMVDLSGNVVLGSNRSIKIGEDCFLPTDALNNEDPDNKRREITGNVSLCWISIRAFLT